MAVWVDNSDDPAYPPGKPQAELDFAYFGGMYRDVWLISTGKIHVTDSNEVDRIAGGGVFVHYEDVSASRATVCVETHLANGAERLSVLSVETILQDGDGREVARGMGAISLAAGKDGAVKQKLVAVPQDPAFMDACDALGMFVIITTPGWQFWNKDPVFEQRVYADICNMVRRDRNRPSVWLWEPILNETDYPGYFAERVHQITHEEYPHPGCTGDGADSSDT